MDGKGAVITPTILDSINNESAARENKGRLEELGGIKEICLGLGVEVHQGLEPTQIDGLREKFGHNTFPDSPMESFLDMLITALSDATIMILIAAASVSLIIGIISDPEEGWIEGTAIFIAVGAVSMIGAGNDYSKQLQFKALEDASARDEMCAVLRSGRKEMIPVQELVVGDIIVFQSGDSIPADCVIFDSASICKTNESSLTGETDDLRKSVDGDPFMLSSCLVIEVEGQECRALVIAVGPNSQWGKIKGNLSVESSNTPLQDKLELMTTQISYIGVLAATGTFFALFIRIWAAPTEEVTGDYIVTSIINAFIMGVTIVVVAIPEGLPLAVTISLAYSTKKMYSDNCFIRVLAACETMGSATSICSDKTGTLTENKMAVVEGWFGNTYYDRDAFTVVDDPSYWAHAVNGGPMSAQGSLAGDDSELIIRQESHNSDSTHMSAMAAGAEEKSKEVSKRLDSKEDSKQRTKSEAYRMSTRAPPIADGMKKLITEHIAVNRTAYLITHDRDTGVELATPAVQGSKTEGALILLARAWGLDYDQVYQS
jgi:calcium-translocating P-type ATPase